MRKRRTSPILTACSNQTCGNQNAASPHQVAHTQLACGHFRPQGPRPAFPRLDCSRGAAAKPVARKRIGRWAEARPHTAHLNRTTASLTTTTPATTTPATTTTTVATAATELHQKKRRKKTPELCQGTVRLRTIVPSQGNTTHHAFSKASCQPKTAALGFKPSKKRKTPSVLRPERALWSPAAPACPNVLTSPPPWALPAAPPHLTRTKCRPT